MEAAGELSFSSSKASAACFTTLLTLSPTPLTVCRTTSGLRPCCCTRETDFLVDVLNGGLGNFQSLGGHIASAILEIVAGVAKEAIFSLRHRKGGGDEGANEQTYAADEEGVPLHCLEEVLLRLTETFAKLIAGA